MKSVAEWLSQTDLPPREVLEEVLWTDSPDPKTKKSLATQTWWFCTCRWSSVESPEGWGPLDITDQTLPRDVQCICFPRLTVWDMRHIHVTTPAEPRPWAKHMSVQTSTTDVQAPVFRAWQQSYIGSLWFILFQTHQPLIDGSNV